MGSGQVETGFDWRNCSSLRNVADRCLPLLRRFFTRCPWGRRTPPVVTEEPNSDFSFLDATPSPRRVADRIGLWYLRRSCVHPAIAAMRTPAKVDPRAAHFYFPILGTVLHSQRQKVNPSMRSWTPLCSVLACQKTNWRSVIPDPES